MDTRRTPEAAKAIETIVSRYRNIVVKAAVEGAYLRIVTPDLRRPDLQFRGDGEGRAELAICTGDGDRHVVFTRWPDGDYLYPERWPEPVPIPNYDRDPIP